MYTGTTPAAARGIAPELLKAPDRRRTLASAGLLFFSYLYIYTHRSFLLPSQFLLYTLHLLFSLLSNGKRFSRFPLYFLFPSLFFYLFFTVHKKRTKYYSAHKLVGFEPTPTPTHTHTIPNNNNITDVSTDVYIHYISR